MYLWEIKACLKLRRNNVAYCKVEKGPVSFSAYCSTVTPAFLLQNTVYVSEGFTPYPLCLSIKIT